ncbi:MAG TPA: hypothetical protein VGZ52_12890 [Acidimicrobiales bacterium]|nr:hypothetical protein [Acidimicrobiales bacterium]
MDERREILYWFRVSCVPYGGAPLVVREQWVGALLPVRQPRPVEGPESFLGVDVLDRRIVNAIQDGVAVDPGDALKALRRLDRHEAAQWWGQLLEARRPRVASLLFRRHEGDLLPDRMARMLHPDLETWDYDVT